MTIVGGVATCGSMLLAETLKLAEWFDHVAVSDLIFFQVEAVEERLVEQASFLVVAPQVQLVGILQQAVRPPRSNSAVPDLTINRLTSQNSVDRNGRSGLMYHGVQDALGQVAYLKRTIEVLVQRLDELEELASDAGEMDPLRDSQVSDITGRCGLPIRHHIDVAIEYAGEWHRQLEHLTAPQ